MRHIKKVVVTYDNDTQETFAGRGMANVVNSTAPADKGSNSPARDYCFLMLTLSLPLHEEEADE